MCDKLMTMKKKPMRIQVQLDNQESISIPRRDVCASHSPSVKGVGSGDDVGAVSAHQEVHPVVESLQVALCRGHLCLLDDVQGVRGANAQRGGVTGCLQTAVWIHAVHQAI